MEGGGAAEAVCPACGAAPMTVFYRQGEVPASSHVALRDRAEAERFPRGSLSLGFCEACAFIANVDFDPAVADAAHASEESQGFSGTFRRFAEQLAAEWVDRYGLRGGDILEIGSGKGEFLALICALAAARGVGVDPAFVPGREPDGAEQLTFVATPFGVDQADLIGDAVVCRHTFEHIPDVGRFLATLRATIGTRAPVVLFELPDTQRILAEGAFWDVYYEHCSYFTRGSLGRAFRRARFELLDLRLEYDGQYVIAEGRPADSVPGPHAAEEPVEDVRAAALAFAQATARTVADWRARLDDERRAGRRTVLWGAGSKAVGFVTSLDGSGQIEHVVDINPHKHGTYLPVTAQEVVAPDALRELRPDLVVVMNPIYEQEIRGQLASLGLDCAVATV